MNKMKIFVNRKLHFVLLPFLWFLSFVCSAIGMRQTAVVAKLKVMRVSRRARRARRCALECESLFKVDKIAQNFLFDVFNSNSARVQSQCVITISNSISCQSAPVPVTREHVLKPREEKNHTGDPASILHSFVTQYLAPTSTVGP